eukprot:TRINITY_DN42981_c0_g1_i2.p6 TRINITY_DN42981_c0_g1~~TRINITY_DN42981_c0_g1_i2.p6  ORF type:complete len:115 (-),score=11.45 TRINITY_DN42981_c0_g1_i2:576-920(-)
MSNVPPPPYAFQLIPRAATPKNKFRISSKTTLTNRNDKRSENNVAFTGTRKMANGLIQNPKAFANDSGGVVVNPKLAPCSKTNVKHTEVIASLKDLLVTVNIHACSITQLYVPD